MLFWVVVVPVVVLAVAAWLAYGRAGGVRRGLAGGFAVTKNMSLAAVRRRALHTRPATVTTRATSPHEVGIELARVRWWVWWWRTVYATLEDVVLLYAPPRTGKTGWLARAAQNAPGAVFVSSARSDLHRKSVDSRRRRPVHVLNPDGIGGITSTVRWSPIHGCRNPQYAMRVAGLLVGATEGGEKDRKFWKGISARTLRALLAAADLDGRDMWDVVRWYGALSDRRETEAVDILDKPENRKLLPGWAADLRKLRQAHENTLKSVETTLGEVLQFMLDPALAHIVTPSRLEHFDVDDYLRTGAACYVIGRHREESPIGPLFAAFTGVLFERACDVAEASGYGRLDPPLTMVLDEVSNCFRVPLPTWASYAGGYGIPMLIAAQSRAQLRDAWGDDGAATIWSTAAIKMTFGGDMDVSSLEDLSTLCGARSAEYGATAKLPVLTPDEIRTLPDGDVLILRRNTAPVIGRALMVWDRQHPPVAEPLVPDMPVNSDNVIPMFDRAA